MASSLVRFALSGNCFPLVRKTVLPTVFPALKSAFGASKRFISTSGRQKDSVATLKDTQVQPKQEKVESLEDKEENWISYGYHIFDRDYDEFAHHAILFLGISVLMSWGFLFMCYYPDYRNNAWIQREAYLELERREKAGLPLIDRDLIDPAKIVLPTDEELGDFEIIV